MSRKTIPKWPTTKEIAEAGVTRMVLAGGSLAPARGSVSAEEWWTDHARLLSKKMQVGGVKSFRIELNERGNYEFEVVPTAETPNSFYTPTDSYNNDQTKHT